MTVRPFRFLYLVTLTALAWYLFGGWAAVLVALATVDFEPT